MRGLSVVVVAMMVAACSSETTGSSDQAGGGKGCADVSGNYSVDETKVSGDCDIKDAKGSSITIGSDDQGLYVLIPGVEGGCPGTLDSATCRFKAECRVFDTKDTTKTLATFNVDYTFAGKALSGSVAVGRASPFCTANLKHEGTRL